MKDILLKNKAVIKFLILFLGCYLLLAGCYKLYLFYGSSAEYYPDYFTNLVAEQSSNVVKVFGYDSYISKHPNNPSMKFYINNNYIVRIVEGCNSISILILFVSFIIAFHTKFKATFLYLLAGSVLIYALNVLRITLLAIGIYKYPESQDFLHDIAFPAIIYGSVFTLWLLWVKIAAGYKKKVDE
ncbi:exosortase family protein XrtF [Mesonia aestuariivivens]|uniref:Exosortase family protein XrtF n=1 Tax=Mesonia aestuariivivens TaxID=2796128 RepID=A0ABS6W4P6_9FLAO|nr:exosortase family protein XrtF [Mesonia aestuariivivens]MBW2962689.1 exosortase family protein XrtF [Mesonia aestuariivivens]